MCMYVYIYMRCEVRFWPIFAILTIRFLPKLMFWFWPKVIFSQLFSWFQVFLCAEFSVLCLGSCWLWSHCCKNSLLRNVESGFQINRVLRTCWSYVFCEKNTKILQNRVLIILGVLCFLTEAKYKQITDWILHISNKNSKITRFVTSNLWATFVLSSLLRYQFLVFSRVFLFQRKRKVRRWLLDKNVFLFCWIFFGGGVGWGFGRFRWAL